MGKPGLVVGELRGRCGYPIECQAAVPGVNRLSTVLIPSYFSLQPVVAAC